MSIKFYTVSNQYRSFKELHGYDHFIVFTGFLNVYVVGWDCCGTIPSSDLSSLLMGTAWTLVGGRVLLLYTVNPC